MSNEVVGEILDIARDRLPGSFTDIVEWGEIISKLNEESGPITRKLKANGVDAVYYGWNDGAGQSTNLWVIPSTQEALLTIFDHESMLNLYAGDSEIDETYGSSYAAQMKMYEGIPEAFLPLLENQPETYELLNIVDPGDESKTVSYASGVFYFDKEWNPTSVYLDMADHFDDDGGANYCVIDVNASEKEENEEESDSSW